jgi:alpha-glucuronidase
VGGANTSLAEVVSGAPLGGKQKKPHRFSGTAAVSNLGDDPNWTGHEFSAAITYAYGRLAWDPSLSAEDVTREWVDATWAPDDEASSDAMVKLLLNSWEAYENYTAPLGIGFICGGDHYNPDPAHRQSLTNATSKYIGYNRPAYAGTYNGAVASALESVETTPEELLLAFHNVPYTHKLNAARRNLSVIDFIYSSHKAGAATASSYVQTWTSLQGKLDFGAYGPGTFEVVKKRLQFGASEAQRFSGIITKYFTNLTGIVPPP